MTAQRRQSLVKWVPVLALLASGAGAWALLSSRVSALEARTEERKDAITQIQTDVRELRNDVRDIRNRLMEQQANR